MIKLTIDEYMRIKHLLTVRQLNRIEFLDSLTA